MSTCCSLTIIQDRDTSLRLPPELTDHIIHLLHAEMQALFAASLVCKAWVRATRYHLFRSVRLERIDFLRPFPMPVPRENQDSSSENLLSWSLRFVQLLESEHCTIRSAVQSLSIDQRGSSRRGNCSYNSAESTWIDHVLSVTSALLPNLTRLQLEGINYTLLSSGSMSLLLEHFQAVTDLDLNGLRFGSQNEVRELVSSFPMVKNFTWLAGMNYKFAQVGHDDGKEKELSDCSRRLPEAMEACKMEAEMACSEVGMALASSASNLSLTTEEKYFSVTHVSALNQLFELCGDRLKHLVYNVWHWTAAPGSFIDLYEDCQNQNSIHLQLTKNTNLQSLLFQQFRFTHPIVNIPSLLTSISSSCVSTIVFEVDFASVEYDGSEVHPLHLCDYDWDAVDNAIRESEFSNSIKVVALVVYWAREAAVAIERAVRRKMKWCEDRKILVTHFQ